MNILLLIALFVFLLGIILLDLLRKIDLLAIVPVSILMLVALNPVVLFYSFYTIWVPTLSSAWKITYLVVIGFFLLYFWVRVGVFPYRDGHKTGIRLKAMIGGRSLIYRGLWLIVMEALWLIFSYKAFSSLGVPTSVIVSGIIWGSIGAFALLFKGILRIFFTSRRLSIVRRGVMLLTAWIPIVNIIVLLSVCRTVYNEYDFALYKQDLRAIRAHSDICKLKYPLVMVHGVLFKDLRYFNYWGRIPKELTGYGATIYYGNQEAVGTSITNGEDLRKRIFEVMKETGAPKVNIIAHSKGGLDSRYAISSLGMSDYVASLTTINSPHRGCKFVDSVLNSMPEKLHRGLAKIFDNAFRKMGDERPDFYGSTREFRTEDSEKFNKENPDSPKVYYQSYMSIMKNFRSDSLLSIPYLMIKKVDGANDGLVSIPSGTWGNYRGLFTSTTGRGISHADMIDLKREDYKGFDVVEQYVKITTDLKNMGY